MTPEQRRIYQRLKDDFGHFAEKCLKIRTKTGAIQPFSLNKAQTYIHERIEEQFRETGLVRALILKGRQQGSSTYVEGRFYWKVVHRKGVRAFILTHEQDATNNLFEMADRYHRNCHPLIKPNTGASNAKELYFDLLDSGYKVGTAGTKGTGRSSTVQYFHGSEVAYWPNAETHAAGVLQAVPDAPGTEVILESTANGLGNYFHAQWQKAEAGASEYIAIFVPWYWQDEYQRAVPEGFKLDEEEEELKQLYGLTDEQVSWRRAKIQELGSDWLFKQEYPSNAAEAFQTSGEDTLISSVQVMRARKAALNPAGPLVIGVDPARFGDDRTSIIRRKARRAFDLESFTKLDTMEVAGRVVKIINDERPLRVFVDVGGLGAGVVDRLNELGYGHLIEAVNGGESPLEKEKYYNKRAEMWAGMRDWLEEPAGVDIPDLDSLHADLTAPAYSYDSNSRLKLEKKEDIKKRGLRSPDEGDALGLNLCLYCW